MCDLLSAFVCVSGELLVWLTVNLAGLQVCVECELCWQCVLCALILALDPSERVFSVRIYRVILSCKGLFEFDSLNRV